MDTDWAIKLCVRRPLIRTRTQRVPDEHYEYWDCHYTASFWCGKCYKYIVDVSLLSFLIILLYDLYKFASFPSYLYVQFPSPLWFLCEATTCATTTLCNWCWWYSGGLSLLRTVLITGTYLLYINFQAFISDANGESCDCVVGGGVVRPPPTSSVAEKTWRFA